jgi:hypothetical protein
MARSIVDRKVYGATVIARLASVKKLPAALAAPLKSFREAQAAYKKSADAVDVAERTKSKIEKTLAANVVTAGRAIDDVATALVGAKLVKRTKPLGQFASYAPSEFQKFGTARALREGRALIAKVTEATKDKNVAKTVKAFSARVESIATTLGAVNAPSVAYTRSLAKRTAAEAAWDKAFERLRKRADAEWVDEHETYKAVFAKLAPQQEVKPRKRKNKKTPAPAKDPHAKPGKGASPKQAKNPSDTATATPAASPPPKDPPAALPPADAADTAEDNATATDGAHLDAATPQVSGAEES